MPDIALTTEPITTLRAAREAAGLTQRQLADKAGTSQMMVCRLETRPSAGRPADLARRKDVLGRCAAVLQVPVEQLLADGNAA